MNLPAVEIDISIYRGVLMSTEELEEAVLSTAARHWLRVRKEREKPACTTQAKELDNALQGCDDASGLGRDRRAAATETRARHGRGTSPGDRLHALLPLRPVGGIRVWR